MMGLRHVSSPLVALFKRRPATDVSAVRDRSFKLCPLIFLGRVPLCVCVCVFRLLVQRYLPLFAQSASGYTLIHPTPTRYCFLFFLHICTSSYPPLFRSTAEAIARNGSGLSREFILVWVGICLPIPFVIVEGFSNIPLCLELSRSVVLALGIQFKSDLFFHRQMAREPPLDLAHLRNNTDWTEGTSVMYHCTLCRRSRTLLLIRLLYSARNALCVIDFEFISLTNIQHHFYSLALIAFARRHCTLNTSCVKTSRRQQIYR